MVKILLIRHAESANNRLSDEMEAEMKQKHGPEKWYPEYQERYVKARDSDPKITDKGKIEAEKLGKYLAAKLKKEKKEALIYCSAMTRCIQTITPLSKLIETQITLRSNIYEVYGVFKPVIDQDGKLRKVGAEAPTRDELLKRHSVVGDVSHLAENGSWTTDYEKEEEAVVRAKKVSEWIMSKEFEDAVGDRVCVIVSHGFFISLVLKALINVEGNEMVFDKFRRFKPINTVILELDVDSANNRCYVTLGNTPHLATSSSTSTNHLKQTILAACAGFVIGAVTIGTWLHAANGKSQSRQT